MLFFSSLTIDADHRHPHLSVFSAFSPSSTSLPSHFTASKRRVEARDRDHASSDADRKGQARRRGRAAGKNWIVFFCSSLSFSLPSSKPFAHLLPQPPIRSLHQHQVYLLSDALRLDEVSALLALVTAHDERGSATAEAAAGVFFDERAAVARTLHALLSAAAVPSDATPPAVAAVASAFVRDLLGVTVEGEAGGGGKRCALIKRLVEVVDDAGLEPEEEDQGGMAMAAAAVPSSATLPAALGGSVVAASASQEPRAPPSLLSVVVDARGCEVDRRSLVAAERATLCECLLFAVRLHRTLDPADAAAVVDLARVMALRARFARRQQQQQQAQQQMQRGGGGNGGQQLSLFQGAGGAEASSSSPLPAPAAVTLQHAHIAALAAVAALLPSAAAAPLSSGAGGNNDENETDAAAAAAASAEAAEDDAALSALASDAALTAKLDASSAGAAAASTPPQPISMLSPHSQYLHSSSLTPHSTTSTDDENLAAILRVSWGALISLHGPATAAARERADAAVSSALEAGALRSLTELLRSPELAADAAPSARRAGAAAAHDALAALLESDAGRDAVSDLAARSSERAALAAEAEEAAANAAARDAEQAAAATAGLYLPTDNGGDPSAAATPFASASSAFNQGDFADPQPNADGLEHVLDLLAACLSTAPELWLDGGLRAGVVAEFLEYCASHPVLCEAPEALAAYTRVLCSVARGGAGGAAAVLNQLRSGTAGGGPNSAVSWRQGFGAMIAYCERYSGPSSASASAAAAEAAAASAAANAAASSLYGASVDIYGNPIPPNQQQLLQQQQQQLQQQANAPSTAPQPSELAVPDSDAEGMAAYARLAAAVLRSAPRSEAAAWRAALEAEAGGVPLAELALQLMCHPVPQHLKAALDGLLEALAREPGAALPLLDRLALVLLAPSDGGRGGRADRGGGAAALTPSSAAATLGYISDLAASSASASASSPSSSMPRYDVSYQFSEVEARSEDYCETLALVRLLTTALRRAAAAATASAGGSGTGGASSSSSSSTSSFLPDGGVHYAHLANFVRRDVLGTVLVRGFADQAQRWRLAAAALDHAGEWLSLARGNPAAALNARRWASGSGSGIGSGQQQQQGGIENDAANAMALYGAAAAAGNRFSSVPSPGPLPPALETMLDLLSEGEAFRVALAVLAPGADALAAEARARVAVGAARERAVRSALRLLRLGLQLDGAALSAARAAGLSGAGAGGGAKSSSSSSSSSIYQPLDRALRRELWRVPALLDYCRYAPDPGIQAEALRLARELSPRLRGPAAVDALLQAGAVGLLQQQQHFFQQQQQQQQYFHHQQQMQAGGMPSSFPPLPQFALRTPTPPADRVRDGFAACLTDGLFGAGARPRAVEDLWWWDDDGNDNGGVGGWGSDDDDEGKGSAENVNDDGEDEPSSSSSSRDPRARLVLDVLLDSASAEASLSPSLAHLLLGYDVRRGPAGLAASTLDARFGGACAAPLLRAALTPALSDADPEAACAVLEVFTKLVSSPAPWRGGSGAGGPARALLRQARVVPLRLAALAADVRGGVGSDGGSFFNTEARTAALLLRLAGEELLRAGGPDDQKSAAAAAAAAAVGASSRKAAAAAAANAEDASNATKAGGGAGSPSRRSSASRPAASLSLDDGDTAAGVEDLAAALLDRGTMGLGGGEGSESAAAPSPSGELAASALLSLLSSAAMEPPVLFSGSSFSHAVRAAGAALGVEEVLSACCSTTTVVASASAASASAAATSSFAVFDVAAVAAELEARLSDAEAGSATTGTTTTTAAAATAPSAASRAACRAALEYAAAHNAWAAATASAAEVAAAWAGAVGLLFGRRFGAVCRAAAAAAEGASLASASSAARPPCSHIDSDAGAALAVELASRALQAAAACLPRDAARVAPTLARAARSLLSRAREVCARSVGAPGEPPSRARSPVVLRGLLADALDALKRARGGGASTADGGSSGQQQQQSLRRGNAAAREALHGCLLEILRLAAPRAAASSSSSGSASLAVADALVASAPGGPAAGAAARDAEERTQAAIDRATAVALAASPGLVEGLAADALASSSGGGSSGFSSSNFASSAPARLTALALLAELLAPAAREDAPSSSFPYYGNDDASAAAAARLQIAAAVAASGLPLRLASALAYVHPLALVAGGGGGADGRGSGSGSANNSGVVAALEAEAALALLLRLARSGGAVAAAGGGSDASSSSAALYGSGLNEAAAAAAAELNALSRCAALDLEPEDPVVFGTGGGGRGFGVGRSGGGGGAAAAASSSSFAAAPRPGSARAALARVLPPALRLVLVRLHGGGGNANGRRCPPASTAPATTVTAPAEVVAAAAAFVAAHRGALVRVLLEAGAPAGAGGWEPSPQDLDTASLVLSLLTALRGASAAAAASASSSSSSSSVFAPQPAAPSAAELDALTSLHGAAPELRAAALRLAARFFRVDARSDAPGPLRLAAARDAIGSGGGGGGGRRGMSSSAGGGGNTNALALFDDNSSAPSKKGPSAEERRALDSLASAVLRLRLAAARFVLGECAGHGLVLAAAPPPAGFVSGGGIMGGGGSSSQNQNAGRLSLVSVKDALFQCVENLMAATDARERALAAVRDASGRGGRGGAENENGAGIGGAAAAANLHPSSPSSSTASSAGVSPELLEAASAADAATRKLLTLAEVCLGTVYVCVDGGGESGGFGGAGGTERLSAAGSRADLAQLGRLLAPVLDALGMGSLSSGRSPAAGGAGEAGAPSSSFMATMRGGALRAEALAALARRVEVALSPSSR